MCVRAHCCCCCCCVIVNWVKTKTKASKLPIFYFPFSVLCGQIAKSEKFNLLNKRLRRSRHPHTQIHAHAYARRARSRKRRRGGLAAVVVVCVYFLQFLPAHAHSCWIIGLYSANSVDAPPITALRTHTHPHRYTYVCMYIRTHRGGNGDASDYCPSKGTCF